MPTIFSPIRVKNIVFANRIVMAPMVRFGFACHDGVMGKELLQEYLDRAHTRIGLVISQCLTVSAHDDLHASGNGTSGGAGAYAEVHVGYLRQIAHVCHDGGSRLFAQLGIGGYGYGSVPSKDINVLSTDEVAGLRDAFIRGAAICRKAGLDGVELHGAHTYFLNMLASPHANHRQDRYGGDARGRMTFAAEVIAGIREFAGNDFIISYRMGWSDTLDDDVQNAQLLEQAGVDMLHVSSGIPAQREAAVPQDFPYNDIVYAGCHVKRFVGVPVIVVNDIRTLQRGNVLIQGKQCDFTAYGRPFLADGAFVIHSQENMDYAPCLQCHPCRWFTDGRQCPARLRAKK